MFAFVVPGRLVQQTLQVPESPERFVATIDHAQDLNHITVFLTGQAPFPDGYGATVHLEIPGKGFQLIGALTNQKPSAIFRLRGAVVTPSSFGNSTPSSGATTTTTTTTATLGISCEPLAQVEQQVSLLATSSASSSTASAPSSSSSSTALVPSNPRTSTPVDPVALAALVGKNLFNAVAGFVQPLPDGSGSWIEFGLVEKWYRNFERKLRTGGVGFLLQSD
ncbi:hypothetical protein JCM10212_006399 [Sporobolomyces blumeae]